MNGEKLTGFLNLSEGSDTFCNFMLNDTEMETQIGH